MNTHIVGCLLLSCLLALSACSSSDDGESSDVIAIEPTDDGATDTGDSDATGGDTTGGDTTAGDTTGGDTNGGDTNGGDTNGGDTNGGDTTAGDTTAGDTTAGDTTGGDTTGGDTTGGDDVASNVLGSCEMVDITGLPNTGGIFRTTLPADLSVSGSQIALSNADVSDFIAFDASTGAIELIPDPSRLPSSIDYQIQDASGEVLFSHSHSLVFTPVRIMPLGDSITAGVEFFDGTVDLPPRDERVGYRQFLFDQLTSEGYLIDFEGQGGQSAGVGAGLADPDNNGYPGVDIDFLISRLDEQLLEDQVDVILLHIGTNNTPTNAQGIDDWLDALDVWEAANQPVIALVSTIVPKRNESLNAVVDQFNEDLVARVNARTDDNILLVDQNSAVSVDDLSTEQIGLHPSAAGYEIMAGVWYDALTNDTSGVLSRCLPE